MARKLDPPHPKFNQGLHLRPKLRDLRVGECPGNSADQTGDAKPWTRRIAPAREPFITDTSVAAVTTTWGLIGRVRSAIAGSSRPPGRSAESGTGPGPLTSGRLIIDDARDYLPLFQIDRVSGPYAVSAFAQSALRRFVSNTAFVAPQPSTCANPGPAVRRGCK